VDAHDLYPFVVDPVMISKSGFKLLKDDAIDTLREVLLPMATILTPNVHEAAYLTGEEILSVDDARRSAELLYEMGPEFVLVKGGHLNETPEALDLLYDGESFRTYSARRVKTENTHGTGCTYASAIAAHLAKGKDIPAAVEHAKRYVTAAIQHALDLGEGHGPTNHFFHLDAAAATPDVEPVS